CAWVLSPNIPHPRTICKKKSCKGKAEHGKSGEKFVPCRGRSTAWHKRMDVNFSLFFRHGLGSGNGLLLSGGRTVLIADEVEHKRVTELGHSSQVDGVGHHLGHGHLSGDHLAAVVGGVHTHDAATALVQVADDVAHVIVGHGDLQLTHRLHEHGGELK